MSTLFYRTSLVAALLGSVAMPALAGAGVQTKDVSGTFTVGAGIFDYNSTDGDNTTDAFLAGAGSVSMVIDRDWSAQFDILGEQIVAGEDLDQYAGMSGFGGHLTYHAPATGVVGVFAGYGGGSPTDEEVWSGGWVGLEGQLYLNNDITLYAQAAWLTIGDHGGEGEGFDSSAYLLRGVGRYFFSDDCKMELEVDYIDGKGVIDTNDDDGHAWEWAASFQTRIADAPIYGGVAYRGGSYDATTENDDADVESVMLTLTYLMGMQSLKENDREGVALDTPSTPLRAAGIFSELD